MDVNIISENKDGDSTLPVAVEAPSTLDLTNQKLEGPKKKRRRGKSKRKISKPFVKISWQERRKYEASKRNYRFRKMVLSKTHAPFNNNQFLMEIHKPEPESNFENLQTPSARTRDSSFSVDSEDNYFFSLPEDEEEYLTKEFSSVYEDAQSERLANMSKSELIQEYLLLEAKYDNLIKRNERSRPKFMDEDKDSTMIDTSVTDKDSMLTEKDTSGTSIELNVSAESSLDILQRLKEQEDQIRELQAANEKLRLDNQHLCQRQQSSSSEDSESDSSSSDSDSSSSRSSSSSPQPPTTVEVNGYGPFEEPTVTAVAILNGVNGTGEVPEPQPLLNGFHNPHENGIDEE